MLNVSCRPDKFFLLRQGIANRYAVLPDDKTISSLADKPPSNIARIENDFPLSRLDLSQFFEMGVAPGKRCHCPNPQ